MEKRLKEYELMKMKTEIQDIISNNIIYLATSSKDCVPNVVPIGGKKIIDDNTLLILDVLLNKTKKNIIENPKVAIIAEDLKLNTPLSYQIKGTAEIYTDGEYLQQAVEISENVWGKRKKQERKKYKVRSAVIVKVDEISKGRIAPRTNHATDAFFILALFCPTSQ